MEQARAQSGALGAMRVRARRLPLLDVSRSRCAELSSVLRRKLTTLLALMWLLLTSRLLSSDPNSSEAWSGRHGPRPPRPRRCRTKTPLGGRT